MLHKNIFLVIVMLLVALPVCYANDPEDNIPDWYQDWDGNQESVLDTFWGHVNPFYEQNASMELQDDADVYGWYKGTFFGLKNWEREVCLLDLSEDVANIRSTSMTTDQVDIYTTTLTVSAKRTRLYNISLYEVSWYIRPYGGPAEYTVYLMNSTTKEYFKGTASSTVTATETSGASGYEPKYLNGTFTDAVIEYTMGSTKKSFTSRVIVQ